MGYESLSKLCYQSEENERKGDDLYSIIVLCEMYDFKETHIIDKINFLFFFGQRIR